MKRTPRSPAADEPNQGHRRNLLDAAYVLIAENGLEGLRTRDIAARAGVNISTLHYYFGTKEALVEAVVWHVIEKFTESAGAPRDSDEAGYRPTLRDHFVRAWVTFQENEQLYVVLQELTLRAQRDPRTRAAFRRVFREWGLAVEKVVRDEIRAGALRADVDPGDMAAAVTSFIMGAMMQLCVNSKAFDFRAVSRAFESWVAPNQGS
jgi:AcrR family transcriptional regulator